MTGFLQDAWFFTSELFKFMTLFYVVWVPGFLVAGLLAARFRHQAWNAVLANPGPSVKGVFRAVGAGVVGSVGRKTSIHATENLLSQGVSSPLGFAYLIASRNMTVHYWAIFALSLGAEFATGQLLGALVMIGVVAPTLRWLRPKTVGAASEKESDTVKLPGFPSWRKLLISFNGWLAILKFIGQEIWRFAPSLLVGIVLGGIVFTVGLKPWWPVFADIFGHATPASDVVNAILGAALSPLFFLSPVGSLPVIHALFKTDALGYPGIISFCLASAIHPGDIRTYVKTFGRRQGLILVGTLYGAAVLGGLGSTWIYAAFGFRPSLPPLKLASSILNALLSYLGI